MSEQTFQALSPLAVAEIKQLIDAEWAAREAQRPASIDADGVVSVPKAEKLTDYRKDTIRKWIAKGLINNYGRPGSPRVKISEILKLEK